MSTIISLPRSAGTAATQATDVAQNHDPRPLQTDLHTAEQLIGGLTEDQLSTLGKTGNLKLDDGTSIVARGQMTSVTLPNGTKASFTWDPNDQLHIAAENAGGASLSFTQGATQSGNGAPWEASTAPAMLPEATTSVSAKPAPAKKQPPAQLTGQQAAQQLNGKTGFDQENWLKDAQNILRGATAKPNADQKAALGTQLAQLKQNKPDLYKKTIAALSTMYGSETGTKLDNLVTNMPLSWGKNAATGVQGWFTKTGAPQRQDDVFAYFKGVKDFPALKDASFVSPQSSGAAALITAQSGYDMQGTSWLKDAQDIVRGTNTRPSKEAMAGLGTNLAQMKINAPEAYTFVVNALKATYGDEVGKQIDTAVAAMPLKWGKNVGNNQHGWFTPSGQPQRQEDVYDHFKDDEAFQKLLEA